MPKVTRLEFTDALKQALQLEMDLRHFYESALEQTNTARTRELFEALLGDEQNHKRSLDKKYEELTGHRLLYLNVDRRRRLVELEREPTRGTSLVEQAIHNEQKAIQLYEQAAGLIPPGWLRQMFESLAESERTHLATLKEYLSSNKEGGAQELGEKSSAAVDAA